MKYVPVIGQVVSAGVSYTAMRVIIRRHIDECYEVASTVVAEVNRV